MTHSCLPGADALSRESVGLMAAVMSGHTSLINEVLRQAGVPALAAAQVCVCVFVHMHGSPPRSMKGEEDT